MLSNLVEASLLQLGVLLGNQCLRLDVGFFDRDLGCQDVHLVFQILDVEFGLAHRHLATPFRALVVPFSLI